MERSHGRTLILAAILVWIAAAGIRWAAGSPLGHDEARYALSGRALVEGHLPRWDYVPPGVAALAVPGTLAGARETARREQPGASQHASPDTTDRPSERALRFVPMLVNLGFLLAAFSVARRFSRETAAWTLAVLAGTLPIVRLSCDLLSDLPSAALVLAGLGLLLAERITWRIVLVAPVFAIAFYVRYGSCIPIAIIGVAVLGWRAREILARPWPLVATVALFAVLLVPHVIQSRAMDGSALGILHASAAMPAPGRGLADYALRPFWIYGILGVPLAIVAIGGTITGALRDRRRALLVVIAIAQIVVLGLQTQAQPRYVFVATTLLVIAGVDTLRTYLAEHAHAELLARAAAGIVAITWLVVLISAVRSKHELAKESAPTLAAAHAIRADAAGKPCVVIGRHRMQLEWYSGCEAAMFAPQPLPRFYAVRDAAPGPDEPDLAAQPGHHVVVLHAPDVEAIRCDN